MLCARVELLEFGGADVLYAKPAEGVCCWRVLGWRLEGAGLTLSEQFLIPTVELRCARPIGEPDLAMPSAPPKVGLARIVLEAVTAVSIDRGKMNAAAVDAFRQKYRLSNRSS